MKLKLLFAILSLSNISVFSQTNFEAGYIIKTNGQRVDCLIKNEDWKGPPSKFNYKLSENGDIKIGNISNIQEFGSGEKFKYVVAKLAVEQSSDKVSDLTTDRNPIFREETLFLKVLVEGNASLYYTIKEGDNRFFYKINDNDLEQLVYKRYITKEKKIGENNRYKQQLSTNLVCTTSNNLNFDKLEYKQSNLINQFKKYNDCLDSEAIVYEKTDYEYGFNLSLRPGVTFGSASIHKAGDDKIDFDNKAGFRIGLEAEYIFGFQNGKWSIFIEPTYRNYSAEEEIVYVNFNTIQKTTLITVDYNSIELPVGARYYMFLNKNTVIFVNAAVILEATVLDSKIDSSNEAGYDLDVKVDAGLAVGVGFKFKNKYSVEARLHTDRNLTTYRNINASYKSFSLIAGYNFL